MNRKSASTVRYTRWCLAMSLGCGLSYSLDTEVICASDGWKARSDGDTATESALIDPRSIEREFKPSENSTNQSTLGASLGIPQSVKPNSDVKWRSTGQIPASPWSRSPQPTVGPSSGDGATQSRSEAPSSIQSRNTNSAHLGPLVMLSPPVSSSQPSSNPLTNSAVPSSTSNNMIRQPSHSNPVTFDTTSYRSRETTRFISQPSAIGESWNQLPVDGQTISIPNEQPLVNLGGPIPTESSTAVPINSQPVRSEPGIGTPLEAQREVNPYANPPARRASRPTEPRSTDLGSYSSSVPPVYPSSNQLARQTDRALSSPSAVIGVVATPAATASFAHQIESYPANDFVSQPSNTKTQFVAASVETNEADQARVRLASQVSAELLYDSQQPLGHAPPAVEPPTGWKSIEQDLRARLANCDQLLRRNAVMSAREEVLTGIRVLLRAIDLRTNDWISEPALDQALAAFNEEVDFHHSLRSPNYGQSTARIVSGHTTQALKHVDLSSVSPELAAQHYRGYARDQLVKAAQNHPWAADLFYSLGKTYDRRAESSTEDSVMFRNQAVVCYRAALEITPSHADGANQLGFTLLKLDRVDESYLALEQSIQSRPSAEAWQNMAELYRRRGQVDQANYAIAQVASFTMNNQKPGIPDVTQIDPHTFVNISPNQQLTPLPSATETITQHPSNLTKSAETSTAKSSWFGRLLR